jgi:YidC/Oxa1 family membrane protein insertase
VILFYEKIFLQPIFNALIWFYNVIPGSDIGVAIVIVTVVLKIILFPFSIKTLQSQKALQALQPKTKELQQRFKGDKQGLAKATMELYAKEKVSPFSSCLPLLIQFPFLIALYQAMNDGLKGARFELLYPFVVRPEQVNAIGFGFLDLSKASIPLAILAAAAQFWQTKMLIGNSRQRSMKMEPLTSARLQMSINK